MLGMVAHTVMPALWKVLRQEFLSEVQGQSELLVNIVILIRW